MTTEKCLVDIDFTVTKNGQLRIEVCDSIDTGCETSILVNQITAKDLAQMIQKLKVIQDNIL